MLRALFVFSLLVGLLVGSSPTPATAAGPEESPPPDAVIAVREADLSALLSSRLLGEHSLVTAADLGFDDAALERLRQSSEAAVISRTAAGRDSAQQQIAVPARGVPPVFVPVPTPRLPVPVFVFRPIRLPVRPILLPPVFPVASVLVLPPPPPPLLAPPPPAPCCPRPPARFPAVPIIPEADTLVLVGGGLALLAGLGALRRTRRRG